MAGKLPIGIQDFEGLRKDGYKYVDKTKFIYSLVHEGKPYFLSRPRRFGKSLLLSTLKAYWEGKKELFNGLEIERLEKENPDAWKKYPLLYQTGYLTIVDYDKNKRRYTLGFPNEEVKYGFLGSLMPSYVPKATSSNKLDIFTLDEYVENGDVDNIRVVLTGLFANISYTLESDPFEHYFQAVIYLVFTLLNKYALCEMHTYSGRIDCKVETRDYIYLFEFKRDDSALSALKQIDTKDYALSFIADSRKLFKIGVSFDSKTRKLVGWELGGK